MGGLTFACEGEHHTYIHTHRSMLLAMFVMVFGAFVCVAGTTSILLDLGGS